MRHCGCAENIPATPATPGRLTSYKHITLRSGDARATIALRGAELRRWSVGPQELLWSPDASVWDAVAPVLFPVVGWTNGRVLRVDGRTYPMDVHGFAARRVFRVIDETAERLVLADDADDDTRRIYPFDFCLRVAFELGATSLACTLTVENAGRAAMPYAVGLHPGFHWPEGADARLIFETHEEPSVPVITRDGLFGAARRPLAFDGRRLPLTRDLLAREALCFLDTRSSAFTYEADGFGRLRIAHKNFPHLALWSRPPAPFLCLESWTGHGDPDGFPGELADKPSMRLLPPGASASHTAVYDVTSAA